MKSIKTISNANYFYFMPLLLLGLISCNFLNKGESQNNSNSSQLKKLSKFSATIKTVHGNIAIKFYEYAAPNTVTRIKELIKSGFYDGIVFHRVVPNFVVQGGDPTATGRGGSGKNLKAEFSSLKHIVGTVAMARSQNIDSADSQFYIALNNLPQLDGKYTIFGQVVSGLEILPKIRQGDKMISVTIKE